MVQSMPQVGHCIDNGPMEGFWGMLKSEIVYHAKRFSDYESLKFAIKDYIEYYNTKRYQKRINCMVPLEYQDHLKELSAWK
ncbi:IS3 family transposase [Irregularibacter muris]|uniref:IS3 family transposase n=1 Tax=Irregularibacter muris TaxID=1796619 RepID=A0AAE3HIR2_9FIRM|nr:IS3 family transposase [Irregularibacter muris]MCR1900080.1 IS3 family transposase [Irregularibacter muris]